MKSLHASIRAAVTAALIVALLLIPAPSGAGQADQIILPPGQLLGIYSTAFVNQELIDQGRATPTTLPFEQGSNVYEVRTTQVTYYVRFYELDGSRLRGGGVGGWIMSADSVRGMTPEQVRDKFALPSTPDYFIAVRVPGGVTMRTGTAGEINGWGQGGGQQVLLMEYIPLSGYRADRPFIGPALSYSPYVTSGNAGDMAAYVDSLATPDRYSDFDFVLSNLNLQETSALVQSLRTISPEAYDSLTSITIQQSLLALDSMAAHRRELGLCRSSGQIQDREGFIPWLKVLGAKGDFEDTAERVGFGYDTAGVAGGCDWLAGANTIMGLNLFYGRTNFDWARGKGDGDVENLDLGFEALYSAEGWFFEGAALAGLRRADANRVIRFEDVDRTAKGSPDGHTFAGQLGAGLKYQWQEWWLRPAVTLNLVNLHQDGFTETGAGSLNLKVEDIDASSLIGRLELRFSRVFTLDQGLVLRPELTLVYQYNAPLDDRGIEASLSGQGGSFTVDGDNDDRQAFAPSLEISAKTQGGFVFYGRYEGQLANAYNQHALTAGAAIEF